MGNAINSVWGVDDNSGMTTQDVGKLGTKKGLFNGNIASMLTSIRHFDEGTPHAMAYRYDQLQRIKQAVNYKYQSNAWNKNGNALATSYAYDANGNIH